MSEFPVVQSNNLPASPDQDLFNKLNTSKEYIGYFSLVQGSSDLAKPPHKLPIGSWAFVENKVPVALGESFVGVILAWRACSRIVDKRSGATQIKSFYNPEDERFQEINKLASVKNEDPSLIHYSGFEYLIWSPTLGKFGTYFCSSVTEKRAASASIHPNLSKPLEGLIKVVEFGVKFIQTANYSWYGSTCEGIDIELQTAPSAEQFNAVYRDFLSVTDEAPAEAADEDER
jgi:hypothetical protein